MTEDSIGDILNDDEPTVEAVADEAPVETVAEEVTEAAEPETVERPRGPDGKFIAKGETQEAPASEEPPASQEETGNIPIAALRDERSKRQALESELNQLRQQMAQFQQPPQQLQPQQEMAPPDRWEDPEGYDRWLVHQATTTAREEALQAVTYQRIQTAAAQFRADKPDYTEVVEVFGQMANANPGLIQQMQSASNPAEFAYNTAKLQVEINQHGGIEGLVEARLKARQAEALQSVQAQLPQSAPPSLTGDRSVGSRSGPAWSGPSSLGDILS